MSERGKTIIGRVIKNTKGFAFVAPENLAQFKEDVFLDAGEAASLITGDRVEIKISAFRSAKGYSGKLVRVVERGLKTAVGRYVSNARGHFVEVHAKDLHLYVELEDTKHSEDLKPGAAILISLSPAENKLSPLRGKIIKILADSLDHETDDLFVISK